MSRPRRDRNRARRGAAFIVTLLVLTVLVAMTMAFARQMRTEALASSNHAAMVEARWIARGALEAVRGKLALSLQRGEGPALNSTLGVAAEPIGRGLYWLIRPGFEDEKAHTYGLVGEAGKINLNVAPVQSLVELPRMAEDLAAAIVDWRDVNSELTPAGAESEYYLALPDPYNAKDGPFETIGELMLVRDVDAGLMYGEDVNRSGVMEPNEDDGDSRFERGLYDLVTAYSSEPNGERVNINQPSQKLVEILAETLGEKRFSEVAGLLPAQRPYVSTLDFFVRAKLTEQEFEALYEQITTRGQQTLRGLVDAYNAPAEVLTCVTGMEPGDGELIVAARPTLEPGQTPPSLAWLVHVLGEEKAAAVAAQLTHRSYQFTADIVAVTGDGRGFCRLRAVLDATPDDANRSALPPVLYVQDLTSLGWPLVPAILERLREGTALDEIAAEYGADRS